jgi:hypothetical protein
MNCLRYIWIVIPFTAISCGPSANPEAAPPASESEAEAKGGSFTVTIDGREATPEEQEAFHASTRQLLSDAIVKTVNEFSRQFVEKLEINDPIEKELIPVLNAFGPNTTNTAELWSVDLIRPQKECKEPNTIVLLREGKPFFRFTRATGPGERPVAFMTVTSLKDGQLAQEELFLVYGSDGKWKQFRPRERKETLKGGKE